MSDPVQKGFAFGRFRFDEERQVLLLEGREVPLTARESQLLQIFLGRPGVWLEESWLAGGLWPKAVAPTGELDRLVRALTAALDEGADGVATIQTVRQRGYRLLIPVRRISASPGEGTSEARAVLAGSGERRVERSGERPALAGGRAARRARFSTIQVTVLLLVLAALALGTVWWVGPPSGAPGSLAGDEAAAQEVAAMRAAAAAELAKGREVAGAPEFAGRQRAMHHFEAALQLDSGARNQAAAHAALANLLALEGEYDRARIEAQSALAASIALGEGAKLAEPLAALAFAQLFLTRDPSSARATAERALGLDALNIAARRALVWSCVLEGRFADALRELEPARQPGQLDPEIVTDEAWIRYLSGHPIEARQLLSATVRRVPLFRRAHVALAAVHLSERRLAAAAVELELVEALTSGAAFDDERVRRWTSAGWAPPDASEAARLLEERAASAERRVRATPGGAPSAGVYTEAARIYAQFGDRGRAQAALTQALARREEGAALARIDPAFALLRSERAFRKWLDDARVPLTVEPAPKGAGAPTASE